MSTNFFRFAAPALALTLALGLSACSDDADDAQPGLSESTATGSVSNAETLTGATAAIAAAESAVSGTAFAIDTDRRGWEVAVAVGDREHEVVVDAAGENVLNSREDGRLDSEVSADLPNVKISLSQALALATKASPGTVEDAELDRERGVTVWAVTMLSGRTETEVYLDAADGKVLKIEKD